MVTILQRMKMPVRFKRFYRELHCTEFSLLDIGCGFGSPTTTLAYFPRCQYYGVDRDASTVTEVELSRMQRFYAIDLDHESLDQIPNGYFDVGMFSHVIEHLYNGLGVLRSLCEKIKSGGKLYIEFPGVQSLRSPHAKRGFCHFCDDATHVRLYSLYEVVNVLLASGFFIIKAGIRRDPTRIALAPLSFAVGAIRGAPWSRALWDCFGVAEFVYAKKM
jgi:SAM-dependent methyltransferase